MGESWTFAPWKSLLSGGFLWDFFQKQMVNKYFKAACALIFWMGLYCLICKPVPTTTAFQKRCQIYYKGELEQNSSLAMHHGHYANTTREHISQSISSPLEMPPPNCLSCGEPPPSPSQRMGKFNSVRTFPLPVNSTKRVGIAAG